MGSQRGCSGVSKGLQWGLQRPGLQWGLQGAAVGSPRGCSGVSKGLQWGLQRGLQGAAVGSQGAAVGSPRGCSGVSKGLQLDLQGAAVGSQRGCRRHVLQYGTAQTAGPFNKYILIIMVGMLGPLPLRKLVLCCHVGFNYSNIKDILYSHVKVLSAIIYL